MILGALLSGLRSASFALLCALCVAPLPGLAEAALENRLAGHFSPYLASHAQDPVAWQAWGPEALELARADGRLIFLSSGYFSCHWCHVMQRESFRAPEIAALLNRYFIPVKIDRELLPALDDYLVEFVEKTRGSAGWPLNVVLTPEGYPLIGFTYLPPAQFAALLERLQQEWRERGADLRLQAQFAAIQVTPPPPPLESLAEVELPILRAALVDAALAAGDELQGGFGDQGRFPMVPQWLSLVAVMEADAEQRKRLRPLLELTLRQMATQGLRDHVNGGFFRYTVDPDWRTPHFEKMLYDQALLAMLYLRAARLPDNGPAQRTEWHALARETLDFTLANLAGEGGGFVSSLSAVDNRGKEGGGYLWEAEELAQLLVPEELAFARLFWGMEGERHLDGGYLPLERISLVELSAKKGATLENPEALRASTREKLRQAVARRGHPRDSKQLAAWNGLLLSALAEAAAQLDEPRYRTAAKGVRDLLATRLWDGERLARVAAGQGGGALEDYAFVAAGLSDWGRASGERQDEALVERLVREGWARFYRPGQGWFAGEEGLLPGIVPRRGIPDGPLPSPSASLILVSLALGEQGRSHGVDEALRLGWVEMAEQPFLHATQVSALIEAHRSGGGL